MISLAFTEFYCQPTGDNRNAGSTTSDAPVVEFAGGSWVFSGNGTYTVASGNPLTAGVQVGDFASLYADGASVTGFVGRVISVTATTIGISTSSKSGTTPATGSTGMTVRIGGAWKGPNGADGFPFGFIQPTQSNAAGLSPRVNMKAATYSISAGLTHANSNMSIQGYSVTPGDGGFWTLDSGTNAIVPLTISSASGLNFTACIITGSATTGTNAGLTLSGSRCILSRVIVHDARGTGINVTGTENELVECETYLCNKSNTASLAGILINAASNVVVRCISHDNSGTGSSGFRGYGAFINCIAHRNGADGFQGANNAAMSCIGCDSYSNGGNGFSAGTRGVFWENCNALKNSGYGFIANSANNTGFISNCATGAGTQANNLSDVQVSATSTVMDRAVFSYANDVTPWNAPDTGDFRVVLAAAKGTGRGQYTQTQSGYTGTLGYPDMGAAQHQDTGSGGGTTSGPYGLAGVIVEF